MSGQAPLFEYGTNRPWTPRQASVQALEALPLRTVRADHRRILEALRQGPMTDEQLQETTGIPANAERPRRGELVEAGLVEPLTDKTGMTKSGRRATLWSLK